MTETEYAGSVGWKGRNQHSGHSGGRLRVGSEGGAMPMPLTPTPLTLGHSVFPSTGHQQPGSPPASLSVQTRSHLSLRTKDSHGLALSFSLAPAPGLAQQRGLGTPAPFAKLHSPQSTIHARPQPGAAVPTYSAPQTCRAGFSQGPTGVLLRTPSSHSGVHKLRGPGSLLLPIPTAKPHHFFHQPHSVSHLSHPQQSQLI